jgi:hypothetical protein
MPLKVRKDGKFDTGRPEVYTQKLADKICEMLSQWYSLRTVWKESWCPAIATIFSRMRKHPDFMKQYEKAKEESADALVEEMFDIADNGNNDWMEVNDPDNPWYKMNWENIQRSRLRVDIRKRVASKLKPKKYGDKLAIWWDESMDSIKTDTNITVEIVTTPKNTNIGS